MNVLPYEAILVTGEGQHDFLHDAALSHIFIYKKRGFYESCNRHVRRFRFLVGDDRKEVPPLPYTILCRIDFLVPDVRHVSECLEVMLPVVYVPFLQAVHVLVEFRELIINHAGRVGQFEIVLRQPFDFNVILINGYIVGNHIKNSILQACLRGVHRIHKMIEAAL